MFETVVIFKSATFLSHIICGYFLDLSLRILVRMETDSLYAHLWVSWRINGSGRGVVNYVIAAAAATEKQTSDYDVAGYRFWCL